MTTKQVAKSKQILNERPQKRGLTATIRGTKNILKKFEIKPKLGF